MNLWQTKTRATHTDERSSGRWAVFLRRSRYHIDNLLSQGAFAVLGILLLCALGLDIIISALVVLLGLGHEIDAVGRTHALEVFWWSTTSMLDPGTFASIREWDFRIPMLIDTVFGIILVSFIVAILTNALDTWVHRIRRGRTNVVETQHTVILGWSPYITEIIDQIISAHVVQSSGVWFFQLHKRPKPPCVTVLADMDKADMEDYLRDHVRNYKRAYIRCRRGSPIDMIDLRIVNVAGAKSIIVLRTETPYAEVELLKILLTLSRLIRRGSDHSERVLPDQKERARSHTSAESGWQLKSTQRSLTTPHIVAEITFTDNPAVLDVVAENPNIDILQVSSFVSRLIAQSCLQPGLSFVYSKLFDFSGNDVLFMQPAELPRTFGEAVLMYQNGIVIGIQRKDQKIRLNPKHETLLEHGDIVIVIGIDAFSLVRSKRSMPIPNTKQLPFVSQDTGPTHTLLIGWNWRSKTVVNELDAFSLPGSSLTILAHDFGVAGQRVEHVMEEIRSIVTENLEIAAFVCDTTKREALRNQLRVYDHVVIMSDASLPDTQHADAHTIMTLSHIRSFLKEATHRYNIVTEIMDSRNRALVSSADVDDFVISDKIVSMYLAQIAHEPRLHAMYSELLSVQGNEIYLKPISQYVDMNEPVTFRALVEAGLMKKEVVIGYRRGNVLEGDDDPNELILNPENRDAVIEFCSSDKVIVIAEYA
jgi:hypothetical protein